MKKNLSFIALLMLIASTQLFAQTAATQTPPQPGAKFNFQIKGSIVDSLTDKTIPYVNLQISTQQDPKKAVKLIAADENGSFKATLDSPGEYFLIANYVGKATKINPFTVAEAGKGLDLGKVQMRDNQTLEEVVVTAYKPLVTVDLDKIAYSIEDDPDSKTNNVLEMLRKVPMVTVDGEDKIQLKGSDGFKIYLDGKPSNLISNNPSQVLKSMPAISVKSIEVITDPGAKYDAEGVSGIINIITNKQPMGGYNARVNSGINTLGGYNGGLYLSFKYGKFGFTGTGNFYREKSPGGNVSSYRENFDNDHEKYFYMTGESLNNNNKGQYGSGELSYEIDTLNLINLSFNHFGGNGANENNSFVSLQDLAKNIVYEYDQTTSTNQEYGSTDVNLNYQRTFKKKDELLTASYRYSISPGESKFDTEIDSVYNYPGSHMRSDNNADGKEHTFQLDYTTPFAKIHTLEGGAKYIIRLNESETAREYLQNNKWVQVPMANIDKFQHRQDILSAYLGYNVRYKTMGFKAGLRMEETKLHVDYPLDTKDNFETEYFNLIPSATFSYMLKQRHNFRFGYNMRIQRPGINYLNPYINNSNPKFITQGNPDLDAETIHNLNLNYGIFQPKYNINATLNYSFTNNSIQRITDLVNDISYTTYANIGKNNTTGVSLSAGWNPHPKFRLNFNGNGSYVDIRTNTDFTSPIGNLSNNGLQANGFLFIQYTLPAEFMIGLMGGGSTSRVTLMGEDSGYKFYGLNLNKSFLKKKLTFTIAAITPFTKYLDFYSEQRTSQFYSRTDTQYAMRRVQFSVSYSFGEMKQQIQKTKRGITNDDAKAGESSPDSQVGQGGSAPAR